MKKSRTRILFRVLCQVASLLAFLPVVAQNPQCTIRGSITDAATAIPLPGATVVVVGSTPPIGAVADQDGNFVISGIPVGRYNLQVSYLGYKLLIIPEVVVTSGKETIVTAALDESATQLAGVEVKAFAKKDQASNPMALISARQLTMEEASRYAGGIDDPARLASSFAGVAGSLSSNAIVVRGNAPKGLLWLMEGVEIPNPSHFANVTSFGGGGITALSAHMLSNSDFYSGAFPASYGNALSGIFDMKIRNGNNEHPEFTLKAGLIGIDLSAEGPFRRGGRSSYLFNYRYSTLALISGLLPENAQGIGYQDLSWKINMPSGRRGNFSFWGLLSSDFTGSKALADTASRVYYADWETDRNTNRMGAMGFNHQAILSDNTYVHSSLTATGNYISWYRKRYNTFGILQPRDDIEQAEGKLSADFLINHKFSARHTNRTGIGLHLLGYKVQLASADDLGTWNTYADQSGQTLRINGYTQSRIQLTPKLVLNAGIHIQWFALNRAFSVEPRVGLKWKPDEFQAWSIAFGRHSRLEPLCYYLAQQQAESGIVYPNRRLGFTKATHWIASWERSMNSGTRFRVETFYQQLYQVPVIQGSSFSMSNLEVDWFFNDSLVNEGKGVNYGVDLTLERYLSKGYYYLATLSLFESSYRGGDGVWRSSRFNRNYVGNLLAGKEWKLGKNQDKILGINGRFTFLGGERVTPVNEIASQLAKDVIYDDASAYHDQLPPTWYIDLSASWQQNHRRYTSTLSLHFINLLFQKEFYGYRYNLHTGAVDPYREPVVIPNISYRIDFSSGKLTR